MAAVKSELCTDEEAEVMSETVIGRMTRRAPLPVKLNYGGLSVY